MLEVYRRFNAVDNKPGFQWCNWINTDIDVDRKLSNYYMRVLGTQSSLLPSVLNYKLPANCFPRFAVVFDEFLLVYRNMAGEVGDL